MTPWEKLEADLANLNTAIATLRPNAIINPEYTIDFTECRGKRYYRKRQKKGDRPGPVISMISKPLYTELQTQIANGRQMQRLERERDRLVKRMDAIAALASGLVNNKQG